MDDLQYYNTYIALQIRVKDYNEEFSKKSQNYMSYKFYDYDKK
jgi:hypothetical protein